MDGEPVDLAQEYGKRRVGRWRSGWEQGWDSRTVELGQLADGRWYVNADRAAHVYGDEDTARAVLARALSGGEWVEEPAEWTNRGLPAEPGWRKVGGRWVRQPIRLGDPQPAAGRLQSEVETQRSVSQEDRE